MSKQENIEKLESALGRLQTNENVVYFLSYDTKNNARASVKHIYDMALTLKNNGGNVKISICIKVNHNDKYNKVINYISIRLIEFGFKSCFV